ncbi:MAG: acyltransferase domain-containing protein [Candidatus Nanopelagicales bacterium]
MLVVVAPGQGAQTPGFLTPWLDVPGAQARLDWLSVVSGVDLIEHGTRSDADTIRDTAVAQPLLVGAGLVTLLALFPHPAEAFSRVAVGAGHSVGEITAAAAAGVLTAEQAMVFVRERGNAMAAAAAMTPTGMSAVLGGDADEVVRAARALGLTAANINGAGQIVVAGALDALAAFADAPPDKARVRPLQVAGAFHTDYMAPAVEVLTRHARSISTHDSRIHLLSNADGRVVHDGRDVLARLVAQVSRPVRWDLCMASMADLGVTGLIEIPPAGTLTGLAKRALPGVETLALNSPDDLDAAWAMIQRHGLPSAVDEAPTWRLVVSPMKGIFRRSDQGAGVGVSLPHSTRIGEVSNLRDTVDVMAPHGGTIVEWIVEDGDPVSPGQPIVRLHPHHEEATA